MNATIVLQYILNNKLLIRIYNKNIDLRYSMSILIREAVSKDMSKVLELIKELAVFEEEPDAVILTEKQLINDGFSSSPKFKCYVAELNQKIVGMALLYPRYSTWKGPTIHLEDLIVTKSVRGKGIGFKLFSKVIHYAFQLNVKRVEWAVLEWNKNALDFYKKNGAQVLDDWKVAQMDLNAIKKFVRNENF